MLCVINVLYWKGNFNLFFSHLKLVNLSKTEFSCEHITQLKCAYWHQCSESDVIETMHPTIVTLISCIIATKTMASYKPQQTWKMKTARRHTTNPRNNQISPLIERMLQPDTTLFNINLSRGIHTRLYNEHTIRNVIFYLAS